MTLHVVEREIGGRLLRLETGKIAKQAAGSVLVRWGDTVVMAAVTEQDLKEGADFFPLTVDYRERGYAAGMIFGGRFMKRESRPTEKEILTMRLIDRPIRPLWPTGYKRDVLIQVNVLSAEPDIDPDIPGMIAASAALCLSPLPFQGPTGSVRVGWIDGKPAISLGPVQLSEQSKLDLVVSGTKDAILMVEAGAQELSEEEMLGALQFAHESIKEIAALQAELTAKVGVKKEVFEPTVNPWEEKLVEMHLAEAKAVASAEGKFGRRDALKELREKLVSLYANVEGDDPKKPPVAQIKSAFEVLQGAAIRALIREGRRCDGRSLTDIRPINAEVGILPRVHGSALFTRGETQALVALTLGTPGDEQYVESLRGEFRERFLLHYNFPSFCVGEVKMPRGPGRREIGHGALARRALLPILPPQEKFPYTIRIVSEILESNGSSSMASVCGASLAFLDAGAPIRGPVAGVAMGLIAEGGEYFVVTDILGDEDHFGDMDFKVAGTEQGITALQMDLKNQGIPAEVMHRALLQAKDGRKHVLACMAQSISAPRSNISQYAPKIIQTRIPVDKIGALIGPGGKNIRELEEKYEVEINIEEDGRVSISSPKRDLAEEAQKYIERLCAVPEVGKTYLGEVVNIKDFGVFFEIIPGVDGLCHVSELDVNYVKNAAELVKVGDKLEVKLLSIDELGRLRLSRKAVLDPNYVPTEVSQSGGGDGQRGGSGGERRGGSGRRRGNS